jgi:hypothetical protein
MGVDRVWVDDVCAVELCEDELWLGPLDFASAGAIASAAVTKAIDNDSASLVFSIVTPRIRIAEE